jgi:beta-mannan synthase
MLFYLALAALFTIYDLDIVILIVGAVIARISKYFTRVLKSDVLEEKGRGEQKIFFAPREKAEVFPQEKRMPKVLIQLPMYNEEAHCDLIIQHCCNIEWMQSCVHIQVLDDSTKQDIRNKVDACIADLVKKGHTNISVVRRSSRQGYKAGAMVEGLKLVQKCGFKYVAIFDADFEPPKDFLKRTIDVMESDDKFGFVQTRWTFANVNSFLTWCQRVNLDFHFCVEQMSRSYMGAFFNFNGTAGVWRIECIENSGGWQSDWIFLCGHT